MKLLDVLGGPYFIADNCVNLRIIILSTMLTVAGAAAAQPPVYQCNGVYTDKPCKGGREVDVAPTRGAHSLSGKRKESTEAILERADQRSKEATAKGLKQAADLQRCSQLRRQREAIDKSGQAKAREDERFKIREEQFALKCGRT